MCFSIAIDQPYAPFTHQPGSSLRIPGTSLEAVIYPSKIIIGNFSIELPLGETADSFTALLDLKKGAIFVTVKTPIDYFRYRIRSGGEGVTILFDRGWKKSFFIPCAVKRIDVLEKLSTGNYKKQEWEQIQKRGDLKEILPIWFMAACWFQEGSLPINLIESFKEGFSAIFAPNNKECHTGYKGLPAGFPIADFRAFFASYHASIITIMGSIPSLLVSGRVQNLKIENLFRVDILWSNGSLKKCIIMPLESRTCTLVFPGKTCRLRLNKRDKGSIFKRGDSFLFSLGKPLFLDRFTK